MVAMTVEVVDRILLTAYAFWHLILDLGTVS